MKLKAILLFLVILLLPGALPAQESGKDTFDIARSSIRFPHQYKKWGFQISAGLQMVMPPKDLVENAIQAPLVNFHMTFGLPWKLSLEGDVTTLIVSNQFMLGPRLGFGHRNFYFNVGYDAAYVFGTMHFGGFDNTASIWLGYPNISFGYKFRSIAFTLKGEAVTLFSANQKTGENEVYRSKNFFNGVTVAVYIEQRLWKNHVFVIGFKDNYEKFYWPTWMLFTTFNRFYHIPELSFSWIL